MRCLTLAEQLHSQGASISFICRDLLGNLNHYMEEKGFNVFSLSQNAHLVNINCETDAEQTKAVLETEQPIDWFIVDHYKLDKQWETTMRPYVKKIMVIDDLADRVHDCDLLLDQNVYKDLEYRYDGLVPHECIKLLGPKYALLRPEFVHERNMLRERNGEVQRILISFGGSDPTNETAKALSAIDLLKLQHHIHIDVIVGNSNPRKDRVRQLCRSMPNTTYYCQTENMAELIAKADFAIGAGGSSTWERCFLGLPCLTLITADNQAETMKAVACFEVIIHLGWSRDIGITALAQAIEQALNDAKRLKRISNNALQLMGETHFKGTSVICDIMQDACT